ncbi:MAG: NYN domain-containing protein [Spirochaetales bacterium]|nr:NYN domain-containing protein [Spirochaetales bacterium]
MRQETENQKKLAVLIDADNAQASIVEGLLAEVAKYGISSVKRIYGDWTSPHLRGWKDVLLEYAINPIQQFAYTTGKNATDSAMIIDAMDLLYTENLDGFCVVTSDSDFTKLCSRIREAGLTVYGFGERKTPKPFVNACDKFIYTEILRKISTTNNDTNDTASLPTRATSAILKQDSRLVNLLRGAVEDSADETGWAYLAVVGQIIAKQSPEFDPRNYGYKKLGELIKATQLFEIDDKLTNVRDKRKKR